MARPTQFQTVRSEGAILPPDLLHRVVTREVEGLTEAAYHLPTDVKLKEAISQSWVRLRSYWRDFQAARASIADADETGGSVTRDKWLLPLLQELGFGRLGTSKSPEIDGKTYPIERFWNHVPVHLVGCKLFLDRRSKGIRGAATASPHGIVQEYLNRSPGNLWGIVSNGLQLRLLRDSVALSRQAYLEFDLEATMQGEVYADFAVLWMLVHQSRFESEKPEDCWLEKWSRLSQEQGTRVLEHLRDGVTRAIEALGRGLIAHPKNEHLRDQLRTGAVSTQAYYRQILRIVYRLLFLFVAEDRDLLHPHGTPDATRQMYAANYSTSRLRDLAERVRGGRHADLWHNLGVLFEAMNKSGGFTQLGLAPLGSFLWSPAATPDLLAPPNGAERPVLIANEDLLDAVRSLAFVEQDRVLRGVDYRNLGSEELGSVYESLLELHPEISIGASSETSDFKLSTAAGNERKTTGSYYTPDSLVQSLLDSALEPVVQDALAGARRTTDGAKLSGDALRDAQETALLSLRVCDPACGSGHFLIAAAHRLAGHLARARALGSEPSPTEYQTALRDVIRRCIYGVDINPMAVELCKVALWMESLESGKPLTFLDAHIKCGNSLLGTTPKLMAQGIPDDAFDPLTGDDKKVVAYYKKRNKQETKDLAGGQGTLTEFFQRGFDIRLGNMPAMLASITVEEEDDLATVRRHEEQYAAAVRDTAYENARLLADAWCAAFVWRKHDTDAPGALPGFPGNWDAITEEVYREIERNPHSLLPWIKDEIKRLATEYRFFHWHIEFPEVFGWHDTPPVNGHLSTRVGVAK